MNSCLFPFASCYGLYYLFHCCLFGYDIIRENYMDNDCKEFFIKKYRQYKYPNYEFIDPSNS